MTTFSRRQFMQFAAAGAATLGAKAHAQSCVAPACVPSDVGPPTKILEICLRGGSSPWRSFWFSQNFYSEEDVPQWSLIGGQHSATVVSGLHNNKLGGVAVALAGSTLISQCRVIALQHDLEPHEAAVPFAITG